MGPLYGRLPSGRGCRVTAVDSRPLPMDTRCGASVCTRNARPASCTSRPLAAATPAMPASNKSIRVIMNRYGELAGGGVGGEKEETPRGDDSDRSEDYCFSLSPWLRGFMVGNRGRRDAK